MNYLFKTGYKNIIKTILLALLAGFLVFAFSYTFLPVTTAVSEITGTITGVTALLLLGRSIIVRHEARKGNLVIVEFLLRPKHKVVFGPDKVKQIKYVEINWGRYGRFTKGIIEFNEEYNSRPFRLKDLWQNELTWFRLK